MNRKEAAEAVSRIAKDIGLTRHDIRVLLAWVRDEAEVDILLTKLCDLRAEQSQ